VQELLRGGAGRPLPAHNDDARSQRSCSTGAMSDASVLSSAAPPPPFRIAGVLSSPSIAELERRELLGVLSRPGTPAPGSPVRGPAALSPVRGPAAVSTPLRTPGKRSQPLMMR
jgi:hypothetical protein